MGQMYLTIAGKKIEVDVDSSGNFYDKEEKSQHSTTLKGLQKKLRNAIATKPVAPMRVEDADDGRRGTLLGRKGGTGGKWDRNLFVIAWDDGTRTEPSCLYNHHLRELTSEERAELTKLKSEKDKVCALYTKALHNYEAKKSLYKIGDADHIYPSLS